MCTVGRMNALWENIKWFCPSILLFVNKYIGLLDLLGTCELFAKLIISLVCDYCSVVRNLALLVIISTSGLIRVANFSILLLLTYEEQ